MERSNSGDYKMIFGTNLSTLNVGLMMYGRARWQEAEAKRKKFNTVLIRQDKKFLTSELLKVIQDATPLIMRCRKMLIPNTFFVYVYHIGCAESVYTPSLIQDS